MDRSFDDEMRDLVPELGIALSENELKSFSIFFEMLTEANRVMNLTAITDERESAVRHFADSLSILSVVDPDKLDASRLIDVGTGAGFPGIVLKICLPGMRITLLDSLKKRVSFLRDLTEALSLKDVTVIHGRAEDLGRDPDHRETYDFAVSRAVARMNVLAEYTLPFVRPGGSFIAYKAAGCLKEVAEAGPAIRTLGGGEPLARAVRIPGEDIERNLVLIKKISRTPGKYPRRAGVPAAKPL